MGIAKVIEVSAESENGFQDAVEAGLKKAAETVDNIQSAWIKDQVALTDGARVTGYRVHMHVTFKVH